MNKNSNKCFNTALLLVLLCITFALFENGVVLTIISAVFACFFFMASILWLEYENTNEK